MKALTVCQPYATLIARGVKRVENRIWPAWPSVIGERIAIHAGKSTNWLSGDNYGIPMADMPFGAIVATATLESSFATNANGKPPKWATDLFPWLIGHEHVEGPWCWALTHIVPLETPIPYKGAQGIWNLPDHVLTGEGSMIQ